MKALLEEYPERYVFIEPARPREVYELMVDFAEQVEDEHLRELLFVALDGRGAFGRFKGVLRRYPKEEEKWFQINDAFIDKKVASFLDKIEVEAIDTSD